MVAARRCRSIKLINHRTDGGGGERAVADRFLGNRADRQATREAEKYGNQP
jgi:hypothetical protein